VLNDMSMAVWNPNIRLFHRVAIVARWKGVKTLKQALLRVRQRAGLRGKIKEALKVVLSYLASKRWQHMWFKFPFDIKLAFFIKKHVTQLG